MATGTVPALHEAPLVCGLDYNSRKLDVALVRGERLIDTQVHPLGVDLRSRVQVVARLVMGLAEQGVGVVYLDRLLAGRQHPPLPHTIAPHWRGNLQAGNQGALRKAASRVYALPHLLREEAPMTEHRYDVLAVSRATGLVEVLSRNLTKPNAENDAWYAGHFRGYSIVTVVPTGTYKDGDHYPREEVEA